MQLNRISAHNFGILQKQDIKLPDNSPVILEGPNEAGKSTFLDFLRYMMFGPHNTCKPYNDMGSGQLTGVIEGTFASGENFRLERSGYYKKEQAFRLDVNGKEEAESVFYQRLSGAKLGMYRNIYAFSLKELTDVQSIQDSEMSDKIFSEIMGLGSASLSNTRESLNNIAEEIYRVKGKKQYIPQLIDQWKEERDKLRKLREGLENYEKLSGEIQEMESRLKALETEYREADVEYRKIESCNKALSDFLDLQSAREKLNELPDDELPSEGIKELEKLKNECDTLKKHVTQLKHKKTEAEEELNKLNPDQSLAGQKLITDELNEQVGALREALGEKAGLEENIRGKSDELAEGMKNLDINEEKDIKELPSDLPTREEIQHYNSKLHDRESKSREAHKNYEEKLKEHNAYSNELERLNQQLEALNQKKVSSLQEIDRQKQDVDYLGEKYKDLLEKENRRKTIAGIAAAASTVMAITGMIFWTFTDNNMAGMMMAGSGIILTVIAGFIYNKQQLNDRQFEEVLKRLGLEMPLTREKLRDFRSGLDQQKHEAGNKANIEQYIKEYNDRLLKLAEELEEYKAARDGAEKILNQTRNEWDTFLRDKGFETGLTPDQALTRMDRAVNLQALLRDKQENIRLHSKYKGRIATFREKLEQGMSASGYSPPESDKELPEAFREWKANVEEAIEQQRQKTELESRLQNIQKELANAEEALQEKEKGVEALFNKAGVTDEDAFRKKYEMLQERERLQQLVSSATKNLKQYCGGADPENELSIYWEKGEAGLQESLETYKAQLSEQKAMIDKLREDLSAGKQELQHLESQGSVSGVRSRMEHIQEQLNAYYKEWMSARLATEVLERTKQRFQRERQPAVIQKASQYFSAITGSAYEALNVFIDSHDIRAVEKGGAAKSPSQLSRGTLEQMLLALRLGLIEEYESHAEPLPVVLDDIMVNFDPERGKAAACALTKFSRNRQVLYFTCHPDQYKLFDNQAERIALKQ